MTRSSDTYIVQLRSWLPNAVGGVLWFGPHASTATIYTPLMIAMTKSPDCLAYGWQGNVQVIASILTSQCLSPPVFVSTCTPVLPVGVYNLSSSFWAHRNLENIAQIKFSYMIEDIRELQTNFESNSQDLVNDISGMYVHTNHDESNHIFLHL